MLKIKFGVLVLLLLSAYFVKAQEFNAGIYSGIVASQVDGDRYSGYNKAGFIFGGYVNRFYHKNVAGQLGMRYIQKGSKEANDKALVYYKTQLHYVEMPVSVRYFYHKKVDFEAGLALAYLIKGLEAVNNDLYLEEANPAFNSFDFSGIGGLTFHINEKFAASAYTSYSILPIRPFFPTLVGNITKGQLNNLLYFTLTYKLKDER